MISIYTIILLLVIALFVVGSIAIFLYIRFIDQQNYNLYLQGQLNPFKRKTHFLTSPEKILFEILRDIAIDKNFYVFPQLQLSKMLYVQDDVNDIREKFDWINKLSIDFVIFNASLEPLLAIELNDKTHAWINRKARDQFVIKSLEENNIPFLTIATDLLNNKEQVVAEILSQLSKS